MIRSKLAILNAKLRNRLESGQLANLNVVFTALTTHIITQYAYGVSHGHLEVQDFNPEWSALLKAMSEQNLITKQMPRLMNCIRKISLKWIIKFQPNLAMVKQLEIVSFPLVFHYYILIETKPS